MIASAKPDFPVQRINKLSPSLKYISTDLKWYTVASENQSAAPDLQALHRTPSSQATSFARHNSKSSSCTETEAFWWDFEIKAD